MTDSLQSLRNARERAERRMRELAATFDGIVASSAQANLDDEHDPEGATVAFERSQVSELLEQARRELAEIDEALRRLDRGTYGRCASCGRPIPRARLEARPATRTCVGCAAS